MEIRKGIRLHSTIDNVFNDIRINSGTTHHLNQEKSSVSYLDWNFVPNYEDKAYVAKRNWRKLLAKEIEVLKPKPSEERNYYNTIYFGDLPGELKGVFEELKFAESLYPDDVLGKMKQHQELTMKLSSYMQRYLMDFANNLPFHFHFIGANLPNIDMVACDTTVLPEGYTEEDKKYMGIHNDGAEPTTVHGSYKSGNRFTINLGAETRYFLFVNLSLTQAYNMLRKEKNIAKEKINLVNISELFFKHFPDYPVIRIPQKPYQYYIAPTDHCFHDGSTYGMKNLDVVMIYFGKFQY
ncbi:hypothetical protein SAMN04489761_2135 [Tenacibaculum sp. MAR_2009_124]|uniref:hypothetical protein n=1 Tax=Tenacibaculum sp. MAR_2009_124 TaxID=1250059 RepID=UPI00089A397A|nr:hypothetical protein [Tenacibaculum sp. MAR_2009_124]SEB97333.1 hypothetical protein SAMN04489761_2135 [Tenacibaculum sp. MAR_2009_124]